MMKAAFRLVLITFGTLILTVFTLVFMRWVGQQQQHQPPPHPWFQSSFWWMYQPGPQEYCNQIKSRPGWTVAIPVKHGAEGWEVPCPEPVPLKRLLSETEQRDWLLKIEANDTSYLDRLVEQAGAFDKKMRFAVHTDSQKVARYLRKKAPQWLFAADSATLLRLHLFTSLWLETAMDFWPDFVIATSHPHAAGFLSAREAEELLRRHKPVLWNDFETTSEKPPFAIQGVLTGRPQDARERYEAAP